MWGPGPEKCSEIVAGELQSEEPDRRFGGPSRFDVWKSWPVGFLPAAGLYESLL
ncbi:DEHA2E13904p [Debaryomyces hansenii CBS767]|uniref:DEHA2E13904p n=1 Tax=Debaryomyces hansenii (strain ATCC 36239 / CBS 767 / BCRC 21394 / JCM 1990 / NBRC 0083 / IGC 2968) TaxID=284592 RepID=Q6BPG0_DEBHA|nr:DEHA2E13904p [Debaryomyces hansenii CBS767]CAG88152.1 DEHA2E13904p [Debaryomyces hansenii CBS767]|eukprot:XP_459910.1 DEHA2E13904p [Debaryomyces hansenii CBS767]